MKVSLGHGFTIPLDDNHRCDISLHEGKIYCELHYDVWHNENSMALYHNNVRFFRWELLLGSKLSRWITGRKLRDVIKKLNKEIDNLGIDDFVKIKNA